MAKRKRLSPAQAGFLGAETDTPPLATPAPIATVAGDAATRAALSDLSQSLQEARADGRFIERLALDVIDTAYLVRDRMEQDEDDMEALVASIRVRGQQTPVDVCRLPAAKSGRTHGLISGWRRLTALKRLYEETSDPDFATVKVRVVDPGTAQEAYVAMVEENEIRAGLSFYERARIAYRAEQEGVYATRKATLQGLYGSVPRARRSKIGSFVTVVEALDQVLRYPTAISEKLGLALAQAIQKDPEVVGRLVHRLAEMPERGRADELRLLAEAAAKPGRPKRSAPQTPEQEVTEQEPGRVPAASSTVLDDLAGWRSLPAGAVPGIDLCYTPAEDRIELRGPDVDNRLFEDLAAWLRTRPLPA